LIPEPFYSNYNTFANVAGVTVIPITTQIENNFKLPNKETIKKLITDKTKAILVNNPWNPTGRVYTVEEMDIIRDIAKENNIFIIADEVYREFTYDDCCKSFAEYEDIEDRVIIIDSISKRYNVCGARIGSIASKNKELIKEIFKLCYNRLCVSTLEQIGAAT